MRILENADLYSDSSEWMKEWGGGGRATTKREGTGGLCPEENWLDTIAASSKSSSLLFPCEVTGADIHAPWLYNVAFWFAAAHLFKDCSVAIKHNNWEIWRQLESVCAFIRKNGGGGYGRVRICVCVWAPLLPDLWQPALVSDLRGDVAHPHSLKSEV